MKSMSLKDDLKCSNYPKIDIFFQLRPNLEINVFHLLTN